MRTKIYLIAAFIYSGIISIYAQQEYKVLPESSRVLIVGTSSLHDWDMTVEDFKCEMSVAIGNPAITINNVNFTGFSSAISSPHSIMENKTRSALKAEEYPEIRFRTTTPVRIMTEGGSFSGTAKGELFIAGKTRVISLPFSGRTLPDNTISITGAKEIDMTEFGITPPTAMLGAIKTGKDVKIRFEISMKQTDKQLNASLGKN
ncbi:MAG: YceI family protein [Bacteroidales bacterium]|nr:YceI family protein [Bacteroidales bacterium]